jgi:PAS domain S-box-containing protein
MSTILQPVRTRDAAWFAAFVLAYYFAYRFGMSFSEATASPSWFPDSVLLCALLKSKPRNWWFLLLAALPIRLFSWVAHDIPTWFLLTTYSIDCTKAVLGAFVMRRFMADPLRFGTLREFLIFLLVVVTTIPALSAFAGAALRELRGFAYWPSYKQWFLGDAVAQAVVTPLILYWVFGVPWRGRRLDWLRTAEAGFVLTGLIVTSLLAVDTAPSPVFYSEPSFFAPMPFVLWAVIRFGMPGASGAVGLVAAFMVGTAIAQRGPFAGHSPHDTAFALQNYLLLRSAPLFIVAISMEQRDAAVGQVQKAEERFRRVAHSAPILLWMAGADKLTTFLNQSWLDFTGRTLEQELGEGWMTGVHPDDLKRCADTFNEAVALRIPFQLEYRLRRSDGVYRWMLDTGVPRFTEEGDYVGHIGSALDITERKHTEEMQHALAHSQRLATVGELTATIAHELRQPMSAILLDVRTAEKLTEQEDVPVDELREITASIRESVQRIDAVISRIRGFLRKQDIRTQSVDLNRAAQDVLWLVSGDARKRNVLLHTEFGADLPPVLGDRTQLEQVLLNLVVNGLEAMAGTTESERHLTLTTFLAENGSVEVVVRDRGPGIPEDQLPLLFDSFFTTRKEGMGLGLSIAKSIVVAHNGHIWVENDSYGGASFHFTIPVVKQAARALAG